MGGYGTCGERRAETGAAWSCVELRGARTTSTEVACWCLWGGVTERKGSKMGGYQWRGSKQRENKANKGGWGD